MQIEAKVSKWRDNYVASLEGDYPDEAAFWRNELADPRAAEFWYDIDQRDQPIKRADLIKAV